MQNTWCFLLTSGKKCINRQIGLGYIKNGHILIAKYLNNVNLQAYLYLRP